MKLGKVLPSTGASTNVDEESKEATRQNLLNQSATYTSSMLTQKNATGSQSDTQKKHLLESSEECTYTEVQQEKVVRKIAIAHLSLLIAEIMNLESFEVYACRECIIANAEAWDRVVSEPETRSE